MFREFEVRFGDDERLGPSAAAGHDSVRPCGAVGECRGEELTEGAEAGLLPGLVDIAVFVDQDAAGLLQCTDALTAGAPSDLEDAELGPVDQIDAAVAQVSGGIANALTARECAAGTQSAALLGGVAPAGADAPPHRLPATAGEDPVREALSHRE